MKMWNFNNDFYQNFIKGYFELVSNYTSICFISKDEYCNQLSLTCDFVENIFYLTKVENHRTFKCFTPICKFDFLHDIDFINANCNVIVMDKKLHSDAVTIINHLKEDKIICSIDLDTGIIKKLGTVKDILN